VNEASPVDLSAWLDESRVWAEREMERLVAPARTQPERLHEAMRYALFGGGKRLRPALVRLVCGHLGGDEARAALPAVAIEMVHTYSLVHDDLPCMDDDDLRRGRPTCHVVFGEALAVLAGDALLTGAFELCARDAERAAAFASVLARAAGSVGMVGGQVLDLETAHTARDRSVLRDEVHAIHLRKTAALFSAAAELGAVAADAGAGERARAAAFGQSLGLAFQATDDLLDVTGDAATLGKTPGKDAALDRATLVAAVGFEAAREEARRLTADALDAARELAPVSTGSTGSGGSALTGGATGAAAGRADRADRASAPLLEALVGYVLSRSA
jgi:geranylgeranyl pyrophosphate synthase